MPCTVSRCTCGARLERWRTRPATFITLSRGAVPGTVVFLRCFACNAVYGGSWKWLHVDPDTAFPDGFHRPILTSYEPRRWFFASGPQKKSCLGSWGSIIISFSVFIFDLHLRTPQIVFESVFLTFLVGLLARGGMTFTAFAAIYIQLWEHSVQGTMYSDRSHMLQKLEVAIISFGAINLFLASGYSLADWRWYLRPKHIGMDFEPLIPHLQQAFQTLARCHACWLFRRVRGLIVDGKWSVQTRVCNARNINPIFSADLADGFFQGCVHRPATGSLYCLDHKGAASTKQHEQLCEHRKAT